MVDEIIYEVDWAYWIDAKSFKLIRLQKTIPEGAIVLTKVRGVTEKGVKYVDTEYGIAEKGGVRDVSKKEASGNLTNQAIEYMKANKQWPPNMTIKGLSKDNSIEILFTPSEYDSFNLKFTPKLLNQNPIEFIKMLKPSEKEQVFIGKVEIAKSGRAKCRTCGKTIEEGLFRVGEPYSYEDHLTYRWHHPRCIAPMLNTQPDKLDGFQKLKPDEKLRFRKLISK